MNNQIVQKPSYEIGHEGNTVSINRLKDDWYILNVSDHYDENVVAFYSHKNELKGLADFINNYVEKNP